MLQNSLLHSFLFKHNQHGAVTTNAGTVSFLSRLYQRFAYLQQKWISASALLPNHIVLRTSKEISVNPASSAAVMANLTTLHSTSSKLLATNLQNFDQQEKLWSNETNLELFSSVAYIAKTQEYMDFTKRHGEDAFFIYSNQQHSNFVPASNPSTPVTITALGIADGVGSYKLRGIDPAHMAWSVMDHAKRIIAENPTIQCPRDVLIQAFETIVATKQVKAGGTTALLVMIQQDANGKLKLKSANLGDCGLMVIRKQSVIYRSTDQTHAFNAPYQLAIPPEGLHNVIQDSPKSADVLECPIELQDGDYIVLGSDGLFDNIFDEKIVEMVWNGEQRAQMQERPNFAKLTQKLANDVVELGKRISKDSTIATPFAKYAQAYNYYYSGGKHDDIACIIARATTKPHIVKT